MSRSPTPSGKTGSAPRRRNEQAAALFARAGNAGVAIAVDTRPKSVASRRKPPRAAQKASQHREVWD